MGCAGAALLGTGAYLSPYKHAMCMGYRLPCRIAVSQAVRASVSMDIRRQKTGFLTSQGHRNWHGSIEYLWLTVLLTFHSKYGSVLSAISNIWRHIGRKLRIFAHLTTI